MIKTDSKIFIAGAGGMVGSAVKNEFEQAGYQSLLCPTSGEVNLSNQSEVERFFKSEQPEAVILAAGKVGGILANQNYRADFLYQNLSIAANVIHAAYTGNVQKLIYLGSSCIYPRTAPQPLIEEALLTGSLEPTNEPYAVAKIAGIKLCESYYKQYGCNFYSLMPTNLYGEKDNFDLETAHVIPALIRKVYEAKLTGSPRVKLWGTGVPRREFLYVLDLASAIRFFAENVEAEDIYSQGISQINIGTGEDLTIKELALLIKELVGYDGELEFDPAMPDGVPVKRLNVSRLHQLGWQHTTELRDGLQKTLNWFLLHSEQSVLKSANSV